MSLPPTTTIEALDDSRIADYRLLGDPSALKNAGLFVAEGRLVVRRLLGLPQLTVRSVLVTPPAKAALDDLLGDSVTTYVVDQAIMNRVTGFNMHRGCLALAERPRALALAEDSLSTARRILVLEGINNPDNIGGLFRSAAAFAVDLVVLGPGCADPLYRKSIRTSMAATLQVPFVDAGAWPHALSFLRSSGFHVVALTPAAEAMPLREWKARTDRLAFVAGAEGDGLTPEAMAAADDRLRIEIDAGTDSLNVTVAVSIALYQLR